MNTFHTTNSNAFHTHQLHPGGGIVSVEMPRDEPKAEMECGGSSLCEHGRQGSKCKDCVAKAARNGRKRKEDRHEEDQGEYTPGPSKRNRGS